MSDATEHLKIFTFKSVEEVYGEELLNITIPEKVEASYSRYTWPSAPVLAWYLWHNRKELVGKQVLELGAGTGLPGILAAKCGALVTLSESAWLTHSIQNLSRTCELNNLRAHQIQVVGLSWGLFTSSLFSLPPFDLIIASDCFYEPLLFEDIIVTVAFLLQNNPRAKFVVTYQERSADWSIDHLLTKWNLRCVPLPLETFLGSESESRVDLNELLRDHTIHLLEISVS